MFEKIVLRRAETGQPISAGQLAEALLFYQKVHLILDMASFEQLVRQIGPGLLMSVIKRVSCSAVFCEEMLGTHSQGIESWKAHSFTAFSLVGHKGIADFKTPEERIAFLIERSGVNKTQSRQFAKAFVGLVPHRKLSGNHYIKGGIPAAAHQDLVDSNYVRAAINAALDVIPGAASLGDQLKFDMTSSDLGIYVLDNIDYSSINKRRAGMYPRQEPLTAAHLMSHILEARADLALAAFYGGDFASSNVTSAIVQVRCAGLLNRYNLNKNELSAFHDVTLIDCPSICEAIDSGQRNFKEFLQLLDKATTFKQWLHTVKVDEGLVRSYVTDISRQGWMQSIPGKTVRYMFTAAADFYNPLIGVGTAIADTFIVEKLLGGWRPNHFVDNRLANFLKD